MDDQRQHLDALRQAHQRRLHELELKEAAFGLNTPPEVRTELADIRAKIAELDKQLGPAASRVLPAPVLDFVGREHEIEQLVQVISQALDRGVAAICGIRA